jgi:hypothetical protein
VTKIEFLAELAKRGRGKFKIDMYNHVRTENDECPICFLCRELTGRSYKNFDFKKAGLMLDLDYGLMNTIVDAADKANGRPELLAALGLK